MPSSPLISSPRLHIPSIHPLHLLSSNLPPPFSPFFKFSSSSFSFLQIFLLLFLLSPNLPPPFSLSLTIDNSSSESSSFTKMKGRRADARYDYRHEFGEYVQYLKNDTSNSSMDSRTYGAVALFPAGSIKRVVFQMLQIFPKFMSIVVSCISSSPCHFREMR